MLLGNYSVLSKHPGRDFGGGAIGLGNNRGDFGKSSPARAAFVSGSWSAKSGVPDGYRPPATWVIPLKAGALSARNALNGSSTFAGAIAGGKNATADLTGSGSLAGIGALIVSLVAGLTGSGTINSAAAVAYLQLAADLTASGNLSGAATAKAAAIAALTGSGTATTTLTAKGVMAADVVVTGTGLTTANVGDAVWGALLEEGFDASRILRIIAAATAGESTGGPGSPVFRNLADTQNQVSGTANSSGDRSSITYGS